jgi:hypothetical protein
VGKEITRLVRKGIVEVKMSKMKVVQSSRRGFVMALALFLVVIFLITGVGLLGLGLNARVYAVRTADSTVARVAADAGLEKAISVMNRKLEAGWDDSVLPRERDMTLSNCEGTFSYIVTQAASYLDKSITREEYDADIARYVSSVTPGPTTYVVKAVGRCAQSERTVYATLRLQGCGEYGVLVLDAS